MGFLAGAHHRLHVRFQVAPRLDVDVNVGDAVLVLGDEGAALHGSRKLPAPSPEGQRAWLSLTHTPRNR